MTRLVDITIDDAGLPAPTPEIEQERRVAIFDLTEDNSFVLPGHDGPLHLLLAIRERRLVFDLTTPKRQRWPNFTCPWARSARW